MEKGVGLACIHYTVDPTDPKAIERLIAWIGGAYERHWSVNPHWEADFKKFSRSPGRAGSQTVQGAGRVVLPHAFRQGHERRHAHVSRPCRPKAPASAGDGAHSGNPHVRARKGMAEVGRLGLRAAGRRTRVRVHRHAHPLDLGTGQLSDVGPQRLSVDCRRGGSRRQVFLPKRRRSKNWKPTWVCHGRRTSTPTPCGRKSRR